MRVFAYFLILIYISVSFNVVAQSATINDNKLCLKLAPLSVFDIYSGMSIRAGLEYKIKNNFALYNEIGSYVPNANAMHDNYGYLIKLEGKIYLNKSNLTLGQYLSTEVFFKHQSYYTYDTISYLKNYLKNYYVDKNVGCLTIKYGFLKSYKYRILVDYFIGIGIRFKNITSTLTAYENSHIKSDGDYSLNILKNRAGNFITPNFDVGIKIGYSFK